MINKIKAVFISLYFSLMPVGIGIATWKLIETGPTLTYWGLLLSFLPPTVYFIYLFTIGKARTSTHALGWTLVSLLGMILTIAGAWEGIGVIGWEGQLASAAFFGWLVYIYWYSKNDRTNSPAILLGNKLPAFSLFDTDKKEIKSGDLSHPALFMFHRGNWCPFCTTQIRELAQEYRNIADSGVTMYLISPQSEDKNANLSKKFEVPFVALRDRDNAAATRLGILHEAGLPMGMQVLGYDTDTVYPTVIVTDAEGKVRFSDQTDNYRLRPEPDAFIKVIQGLG